MAYSLERDIKALTEAASLCCTVQEEMVAADTLEKKDRSPVSVADYGSQGEFPVDPREAGAVSFQTRHYRQTNQILTNLC